MRSLGSRTAELSILLEGVEFKQQGESAWRMEEFHILKERLEFVENEEERAMLAELLRKYEEHVVPSQHKLRWQVIQNDVNELNILAVD